VTTESVERRILGAIRCVDVPTGLPITSPLVLQATGASFARTRSGYSALMDAPGLHDYTLSFNTPPATPAVGSVSLVLTVSDPANHYLTRRRGLALPPDPNPANATGLFTPMDVQMFPSPIARTAPGWAVVRASVAASNTGAALPGALIRVVRTADSALLGRGVSDKRGEALVAIAGIPVTTWDSGSGSVLASEIDVTLHVVYDQAVVGAPDPDDLETRQGSLPQNSTAAKLASGRVLVIGLSVAPA
jgi:hypothetical protein